MGKPDLGASVKQRLLNLARERGEDFNLLLTSFGVERLLHRIAQSSHGSEFVLKGATLFRVWSDLPHRPTRDLDLMGHGSPELDRVEDVFRAVCDTEVESDGVSFREESVRAERIRDDAEYEGVRVTLEARLGTARLPMRIDIGFGDALVPPPVSVEFPVLLGHEVPLLRAYRPETVVAEKLHAVVDLGMANSRMKDFFDLRFMATHFEFDGEELARTIQATFDQRSSPVPASCPKGLSPEFATDDLKAKQWRAFLRRSRLAPEECLLGETVDTIGGFLLPLMTALADGREFRRTWRDGGPWREDQVTPEV